MKKTILILFIAALLPISIFSQENSISKYAPFATPFAKVFSNFHSGLSEDNNSSAFQITRAYLGSYFTLSENFKFKVNFDIGNPSNSSKYERTAYVKNAYLNYHKGKLAVNFGLIGLIHTPVQEKSWGRRYIYQSFMNQYGFVSTADMGISMSYTFCEKLKFETIIFNGEGYKKLQADSTYVGAMGLTYKPLRDITIRFLYDRSFGSSQNQEASSIISGFIEYNYNNKFLMSAEYNLQNNNKFNKDQDLSGYSVYALYRIKNNIEFFGRFDQLNSNTVSGTDEPWNIKKNGRFFIAGIQFAPVKGVTIALNYQNWIPVDSEKNNEPRLYINFEYKF